MSDLSHLVEGAHKGDRRAAAELLPLVYEELRKLAAAKLAAENPGHTLNATALVHEAYLLLVGDQHFDGRGHFFAAAAEAMRRILIESARRKARLKHGGELQRLDIEPGGLLTADVSDDLLALDEALDRLAAGDSQAAELVKLRYFAGLTVHQAAELLGVSPRKADSLWSFARAWLRREIEGKP
jgi:RNA polymerase sigma factor (TIGR02999 family)